MTAGMTPKQADLWRGTAAVCQGRVGQQSIWAVLYREGDRLFGDELFADLFAEVGRRSVPPRIVATVMVLQRLGGLSDREAVEAFSFDVRWKYACGGLAFDNQPLRRRLRPPTPHLRRPVPRPHRSPACPLRALLHQRTASSGPSTPRHRGERADRGRRARMDLRAGAPAAGDGRHLRARSRCRAGRRVSPRYRAARAALEPGDDGAVHRMYVPLRLPGVHHPPRRRAAAPGRRPDQRLQELTCSLGPAAPARGPALDTPACDAWDAIRPA
jgi:hypothetical protein